MAIKLLSTARYKRAFMVGCVIAFRLSNSRTLLVHRRNLANLAFVRVLSLSTWLESSRLIVGYLTGHSVGPDVSDSPNRP